MRGDFSVFRKELLRWFDGEKRDLPWRTRPSLYKTVVSEFMLQQTQVETVLPYFARWLARFPGFEELAQAGEEDVMKHWEGLGYYSRARNLHRLAKSIVADGVPDNVTGWLERPGVGPYTAAAIASIAQGIPEPVIDGNVIRVLARLTMDQQPLRSAADGRKRYLSLARDLIDPERPGAFNEAVMELGATVCRKAKPMCLLCPVRDHCKAAGTASPGSIPVIERKPTRRREVARLWLRKNGKLLLHFHPQDASRLAGMAELPSLDKTPGRDPLLVKTRGISSEQIRESIFALEADHPLAKTCQGNPECRWIPLDELTTITLSGPHRRWIGELLDH
ncbi:MAG: A/G-specific adenine glycosylase [Puniceicoccaceae bacterium]